MDLGELARAGRRLKGSAQTINLGADIFLADTTGHYLGRICHYRECHPRVLCHAQHCGQRDHLNDDLHIVTLSQELIASASVELWPKVILRITIPMDVENTLLTTISMARMMSSLVNCSAPSQPVGSVIGADGVSANRRLTTSTWSPRF